MSDERDNAILKGATNEWVLLGFRTLISVCSLIVTTFVVGTRSDLQTIGKELTDFKILYEGRVAHIEGAVSEIKSSIEAHRTRIAGNDMDIRSIWTRIYELTSRMGSSPPK